MATQVQEVPLFPLDVVLFPGMVLPLHIFEERYKKMVKRCLRRDVPFGVVLMRGTVDGLEVPYEVGTIATIAESTRLEGGRYNITVVGVERFVIRSLAYDIEPYLVGQVEPLVTRDADSVEAHFLSAQLRPSLEKYLALLGTVIDRSFTVEPYPESPVASAFLTAILLQIPNPEKQALLAISSIPEILREEIRLLDHENMIMQFMAENREALPALVDAPTGVFSAS
jgi:Lon protease-like protein